MGDVTDLVVIQPAMFGSSNHVRTSGHCASPASWTHLCTDRVSSSSHSSVQQLGLAFEWWVGPWLTWCAHLSGRCTCWRRTPPQRGTRSDYNATCHAVTVARGQRHFGHGRALYWHVVRASILIVCCATQWR